VARIYCPSLDTTIQLLTVGISKSWINSIRRRRSETDDQNSTHGNTIWLKTNVIKHNNAPAMSTGNIVKYNRKNYRMYCLLTFSPVYSGATGMKVYKYCAVHTPDGD